MEVIFDWVYLFLKWLSELTGFTYKEVNIIVYFFVIPSFFALLLDRIIGKHYVKTGIVVLSTIVLLSIDNFEAFAESLFNDCAVFLKSFGFLGMNYVEASVVICVFLPLLVTGMLMYFRRKRKRSLFGK